MRCTQYRSGHGQSGDKPSFVLGPQHVPLVPTALAWSVAPPASVLVYCLLFSNPSLSFFFFLSDLSLVLYPPAWKPENLASLEPSLAKPRSKLHHLLEMAGFTIFKREVGHQLAVATKASNAPLPAS